MRGKRKKGREDRDIEMERQREGKRGRQLKKRMRGGRKQTESGDEKQCKIERGRVQCD